MIIVGDKKLFHQFVITKMFSRCDEKATEIIYVLSKALLMKFNASADTSLSCHAFTNNANE